MKEIYGNKKIKRVTDENYGAKLLRFEAETTDDDSDADEVFIPPRGVYHHQEESNAQENAQAVERPKKTLSIALVLMI